MQEARSNALRHMIEKIPRWVRTDLSSADTGLRERAEDALHAMLISLLEGADDTLPSPFP